MKSKKNIKSIIMITIIILISLVFLNISLAANNTKVIVETANLRETTSENSKILAQMSINDEVEIVEKTEDWCKVKYKNITGYVKAKLLSTKQTEEKNIVEENNIVNETPKETEKPVTVTDSTNTTKEELGKYIVSENIKLKLVPLINATDMMEIEKDKEVNVLKIMNGWAYIETDTVRGWVRIEKIKSESQIKAEAEKEAEEAKKLAIEAEAKAKPIKTSYVKSETVNLRKEANTTSEKVGSLPQNTSVEVLVEENGWSKCRVNGLIGYISTQYLSDTKIEKQETSRGAKESRVATEKSTPTESQVSSGEGGSVIAYAQQFLGASYVYGGNGPNSFDCSGFTSYVYRQFGISLNRTAGGQFENGVSVSNLEAGDLVMFGTSKSNIYHVGIYMGGDTFIHAANASRGVTTDRLSTYSNYYGARRVM